MLEARERAIRAISTNTLLAEGDARRHDNLRCNYYFNQHPPRGG